MVNQSATDEALTGIQRTNERTTRRGPTGLAPQRRPTADKLAPQRPVKEQRGQKRRSRSLQSCHSLDINARRSGHGPSTRFHVISSGERIEQKFFKKWRYVRAFEERFVTTPRSIVPGTRPGRWGEAEELGLPSFIQRRVWRA